MAVSIKLNTMSYRERIRELRQEIRLFEELETLEAYFKPLRNVNNMYMLELRRIYAQKLYDKGLTYSEIGRTFGMTYNVAKRAMLNPSNPATFRAIKDLHAKWLKDNVYPVTYDGRVYDSVTTNTTPYIRPFTLKPVKKYAKENVSAIYSYGVNHC
jgi:uncharacterized protein YerC